MNEEEKKAIEKALWHLEKVLIRKDDIDQYAVILDYIEKQQKDIKQKQNEKQENQTNNNAYPTFDSNTPDNAGTAPPPTLAHMLQGK